MVRHKTLKAVSVHISGKKFLEFALKKVEYQDRDKLMLSISKGNIIAGDDGKEIRKHNRALSVPFEKERLKRLVAALDDIVNYEEVPKVEP